MTKPFLIFDFDSTLIQTETLDELTAIVSPHDTQIASKIAQITDLAMNGEIDFFQALSQRVAILKLNQSHLEIFKHLVLDKISKSVLQNKDSFIQNADRIYIVSGGFNELIYPVSDFLGIARNHIFANQFLMDENQNVVGVNTDSFLAHSGGKARCIDSLNLEGEIYMIGDGMTDAEVKDTLPHVLFYAYTEHVKREKVLAKADKIIQDLDILFLV
jgi:D-3-phosphoglycerate dehydrogenase